jgi:hypothetical protein
MSIGRNTPLPNIPEAISLQWANGKPVARPAGEAGRFTSFVGFHIEVAKDPTLDEALRVAKVAQIEIRHQRQGGAEIVRHWSLGSAVAFLPITAGPIASSVTASLSNGNAKATADAGIGLRWGRGEGERSKMAVRGYVRALWEAGYRGLVQLAARSRMTDVLLAVLLDHSRAAAACDDLVDRRRHPDLVSPAELWLPLVAGEEAEFGKGDTATVTPYASAHPAALDADYLRTIWRTGDVWAAACAAWPLTKAWALDFAATGNDGLPSGEEATPELEIEPAEAPGLLAEPLPERRQTADEAMAAGGAPRRRGR